LVTGACSQQFDLGIKPVDVPSVSGDFDEYSVQVQNRKVDLLFVIDNSGSMSDEIATVSNSFSTFISSFVQSGLDYNIAVTSTDLLRASTCTPDVNCYLSPTGYFDHPQNSSVVNFNIGFPNVGPGSFLGYQNLDSTPQINSRPVLSSSQMSAQDIADSFKLNVSLGTDGSPGEAGLAASMQATSAAMLSGFNQGFLRPEARLNVIILSDEDESFGESSATCPFQVRNGGGGLTRDCNYQDYLSEDTLGQAAPQRIAEFHAHMDQLKGATRPDLFRLDVISGDPDFAGSNCSAQSRGKTLKEAVLSYGSDRGRFIDLCKGDFAPDLDDLGTDLSGQIERRFKLKHRPANASQLRVFINDLEIQLSNGTSDGFKYTPSLNSAGVDVGGTVELIGLGLEQMPSFKIRMFYQRAR
jgi:hypothetical protein